MPLISSEPNERSDYDICLDLQWSEQALSGRRFHEPGCSRGVDWRESIDRYADSVPCRCRAYEWAIAKGLFRPRKPHESSPEFIGGFSDAGMEHDHYDDGVRGCGG